MPLWDKEDDYILNKRDLIPRFLQTPFGDGYEEELMDLQRSVCGQEMLDNLDHLENLQSRITRMVSKEVELGK